MTEQIDELIRADEYKHQSFEDYLFDQCPDDCQTNNSPEGYERWLEQLDTQEVMELAQEWGNSLIK